MTSRIFLDHAYHYDHLRDLHQRIVAADAMHGADRELALRFLLNDVTLWLRKRPDTIAERAHLLRDDLPQAEAEAWARMGESLDLLAETLWFEYQYATGALQREPGVAYADAAADVEAVGAFLRRSGVRV